MADDRMQNELVLPPGSFAHVLDQTKGQVTTLVGPNKISLSQTDQLVVFNPRTKRFDPVQKQDAIQTNVIVAKDEYLVLSNPARDGKQPQASRTEVMNSDLLKFGEVENIPGPISFALWPGQSAQVVKGHHLRTNQYLLVRISDEDAAKANWGRQVLKQATVAGSENSDPSDSGTTTPVVIEGRRASIFDVEVAQLTTGQLLSIPGTQVSFYIPPTGVEVVEEIDPEQDEKPSSHDPYVRNAVTLERLEYCWLLAENGEKRIVKGPAVVFPDPTETFISQDGLRKFKAYELNELSGLHIQVIADYEENNKVFTAGQELFLTGKDTPIYYPRPEHSVITYESGDKPKHKHHAVAIPSGEARYVMNRPTGEIITVRGPKMFLPDPRYQVIVKRILSDTECALMFPGNSRAKEVNRVLQQAAGSTTQSFVTDDSLESYGLSRGVSAAAFGYSADEQSLMKSRAQHVKAKRETAGDSMFADSTRRSGAYTPPRTITLDTKFEGAVCFEVWPGYAVQIVNKAGKRRTVVGPQTVILEYDEYLHRLKLSTGTPKNPERPMETVFLRVGTNAVSDRFLIRSKEMVPMELQVKFQVRFLENHIDDWFTVDNYVQHMVDHIRSLVANAARSVSVYELYDNASTLLRDLVLGDPNDEDRRPGKTFEENGLQIYDLELLGVQVMDRSIADLINSAQNEVLANQIEASRRQRRFELVRVQQEADRMIDHELHLTTLARLDREAEEARIQAEQEAERHRLKADLAKAESDLELELATKAAEGNAIRLASKIKDREAELEHMRGLAQIEIERLVAEATAVKDRFAAVQPHLVQALLGCANMGILKEMAHHLAPLAIVRGESLAGTLETLAKGTPLENLLNNLEAVGTSVVLPNNTN